MSTEQQTLFRPCNPQGDMLTEWFTMMYVLSETDSLKNSWLMQ